MKKSFKDSKIRKINKKQKDNVGIMDILNRSYHHHKDLLAENDNGLCKHSYYRVLESRRVVARYENTIKELPERVRFILNAELIDNKFGSKWYREFYSTPTYYRNRKIAYKMFIISVNK